MPQQACQKPRVTFQRSGRPSTDDRPETSQRRFHSNSGAASLREKIVLYIRSYRFAYWNNLKTGCANRADQKESNRNERCSASGIVAHLSHRSKRVANHKGARDARGVRSQGWRDQSPLHRLPGYHCATPQLRRFQYPSRPPIHVAEARQNEKADCKDFHQQALITGWDAVLETRRKDSLWIGTRCD